jgi:hypothetical protein
MAWVHLILRNTAMRNLASVTLVAVLGISAAALSTPADAPVFVGVGIGVPGVAVVAPPVIAYPPLAVGAYPAPFRYGYPGYYYHPGFARFGYGYGLHRGYVHGRPWR